MSTNNKFDPELEVLRCRSCGGRVVWVWNKETTNKVRCPDKNCPDYATMVDPEDCQIIDP